MTAKPLGIGRIPASHVLGSKLDSIPFSAYHVVIILVLGFVGFIEGYDLALTGSLLVLAKAPLHMSPDAVRALATWPTLLVVIGGFAAAAMSDRISRLTVMQIGVVLSTLCTLLILFVHSFTELLILRLITGFFLGFTISAPFPIAAELMPAQHRRTDAGTAPAHLCSHLRDDAGCSIHAVAVCRLYSGQSSARFSDCWIAWRSHFVHCPGAGLFPDPGKPARLLRRGRVRDAVENVNLMIRRCGNRVAPLTVDDLGSVQERARETLPSFWKLFAPGQFRWTATGILCGLCGGTVYYLIAILLPKALVSQGAAVATSFGLSSLVFAASIPGKLFNGYIMEIIGRRWTITGAFLLSIPGLLLMVLAHRAGAAATMVFSIGALITGFTTLSCFPAVRMYLSEQFPTALRGRGHFFGESFARIFAGVIVPYVMVSHTASPTIFFGTMLVMVAIGACIPFALGRETLGNLETFTEALPGIA